MQEHIYVEHKKQPRSFRRLVVVFLMLCAVAIILIGYVSSLNNPPNEFPTGTEITIPDGVSGGTAIGILKKADYIKSMYYARYTLNKIGNGRTVKAGTYLFEEPQTTEEILESLLSGSSITNQFVLTLPEGFHAREIEQYLPEGIEIEIDADLFNQYEGYLYPETYYITEDMTQEEILALLRDTYEERMEEFREQIESSSFSEEEVVILASILEREANTFESMQYVSGILQDRLDIGMALQVDATFDYLLDKTSAELTEEDLEIDSPYNTYTNRGLPPTPISNPGRLAILAVLNPIKSNYLYYLTGNDGQFYYATTFEEHKRNKERYLR